ncbi:MAG: heavy metal translocating P-type ATPase [Chloroflexota bacterium]
MISILTAVTGGALVLVGAKTVAGSTKKQKTLGDLMLPQIEQDGLPIVSSSIDKSSNNAKIIQSLHLDEVVKQSKNAASSVKQAWQIVRQDKRQQHLKEMSRGEETRTPEEIKLNRHLRRSLLISLGGTICLLTYPPLISIFSVFFLYVGFPFYKKSLTDIFVKRKITIDSVDAVIGVTTMAAAPVLPSLMFINITSTLIRVYTYKVMAAAKAKTRNNLTNLMGKQPQSVWIMKDGVEVEMPFESVVADDILVIDVGQMIPIDGTIVEGIASVDQHLLTGESQPIEKSQGDEVFAATVVLSGRILIQVEKTGEETAVARIGQMLMTTADYTSSVELRGIEISDKMAGPTALIGLITLPILGFIPAVTVLLAGFGYNMRLLGPLSVLNYLQLTAIDGILIKDGRALEQVSKVDTVVFDKTGTLTLEQPHVGAVHAYGDYDETTLLVYAAAAEHRQTHPIAKAILQAAEEQGLRLPTVDQASYQIGYGIQVMLDERRVRVGSNRFMDAEAIEVPVDVQEMAIVAQDQGYSLVYVAVDDHLAGVIELHPTVRPEAKAVVDDLHSRGIATYIISGDNERPTRALAAQLGIKQYFAETLPENKASLLTQLQEEGRFVCFVGDGINDSIALKQAQVSISLRGATTVATDTAQIILMDETLNQLPRLFTISTQFEANIETSLMTTIIPGIFIVGGVYLGLIGYGGAVAIFWGGGIIGIFNAMRPLFEAQNIEQERLQQP